MIGDKNIFQQIGQILFNASPDGAKTIIMNSSLVISNEGDVGKFEFDYIDEKGNRTWFPFGADVDTESLRILLTRIRESYENKGVEVWNDSEFILDVSTGKFEFNITYDHN